MTDHTLAQEQQSRGAEGLLQDDLRELLQLLGMNDGAQPRSPHEVFQDCLTVLRCRLDPPVSASPEDVVEKVKAAIVRNVRISGGIIHGLDDAARAALSAIPGAPVAWREMRDAPRDGSEIILRFPTLEDAPGGPHFTHLIGQWDALEDEGWMCLDGFDPIDDDPIAWAPIPPPPPPTRAPLSQRKVARRARATARS